MREYRFPGTTHVMRVYDNPMEAPGRGYWWDTESRREKTHKAGEQLALGKMPRQSPRSRGCSRPVTLPYVAGGDWKSEQRAAYVEMMGQEPPRDPRHLPGQWEYTGGDPFTVAPNETREMIAA